MTKVIFRMFKGEVLALFPEVAGTVDKPHHCLSYARIGQHSAADPYGVIDESSPATPEEYASLKRELERIGYQLEVVQRTPRGAYSTRRKQLERKRNVSYSHST